MSRLLSALKQIETKHPQEQPAVQPVSAEELASFGLNRPATPWERIPAGEESGRAIETPLAPVAEPPRGEEPRPEPPRIVQPRVGPPETAPPAVEPSYTMQPVRPQPVQASADPAYRELAGTILADYRPGTSRALMFASPESIQGTTSSLITLAGVLAERVTGDVVVVDGNLTQPALASELGLSRHVGLSEVLEEAADWREAIVTTPLPRLNALPSGSVPAEKEWSPNPLRFLRLLNELRSRYRLVLLDGPSLACPFADAMAKFCDGVYLWVQLGRTHRNAIRHSLERLEGGGVPLLGCIVLRNGE